MIDKQLQLFRKAVRDKRAQMLEKMATGLQPDDYWRAVGAHRELKWLDDAIDKIVKTDEERDDV